MSRDTQRSYGETQPATFGGGAIRDVTGEPGDQNLQAQQEANDTRAEFRVREFLANDQPEKAADEAAQISDPNRRDAAFAAVAASQGDRPSASLGSNAEFGAVTGMDSLFFMMVYYLTSFNVEFKWSDVLNNARNKGLVVRDLLPPTQTNPQLAGEGGAADSSGTKTPAQAKADNIGNRAGQKTDAIDAQARQDANLPPEPAGDVFQIVWPVQNLPRMDGGLSKSVGFKDGEGVVGFAEKMLVMNEGGENIELDVTFEYAVGVGSVQGLNDNPSQFEQNLAVAQLQKPSEERGRPDRGDTTAPEAAPVATFNTGPGEASGEDAAAPINDAPASFPSEATGHEAPESEIEATPGPRGDTANASPWTVEEIMGMIYLATSLVYPFEGTDIVSSDRGGEGRDAATEGKNQFPVLFLRHYSLFPYLTPFVCTAVKIEPDEEQPIIVTKPINLTNTDSHLTIPAVRQVVRITLSLKSAHYYAPFFGNDDTGQLRSQTSARTYLNLSRQLAGERLGGN